VYCPKSGGRLCRKRRNNREVRGYGRVATAHSGEDSKQKITKETKILAGTLKQDFAAFVFFCSICSGQNHPGNAVFENRLVKID
jgi:hypothetical protein